jgi:hypothetical protein
MRIYATSGDIKSNYPLRLGKAKFGLQHFIGKKAQNIKVPIIHGSDKRGSVKVEISIISEAEISLKGEEPTKYIEELKQAADALNKRSVETKHEPKKPDAAKANDKEETKGTQEPEEVTDYSTIGSIKLYNTVETQTDYVKSENDELNAKYAAAVLKIYELEEEIKEKEA